MADQLGTNDQIQELLTGAPTDNNQSGDQQTLAGPQEQLTGNKQQ